MRKRLRYLAAGLALALSLSACSKVETPVPVERADMLTAAAAAADRFAGVVVSDNAVTIAREADKTVEELLVKEGEQVQQGQRLFSYDTDELQLNLDKQELDMDRLDQEIKDLKAQANDIEADIKTAKKNKDTSLETSLNIQLRQVQMEQTQSEFDKASLQTEIDYSKKMLENVNVTAPLDGTVRTISEENPEEYIVIQQTGAYRVKGLLNEMSMNMGIMEGVNVQITSRLDPSQTWTGVVSLVDYENAEQNSYDAMYYGVAEESMTASSSYPFYIALDSTDGLLLGQHVYIQIAPETPAAEGLYIPESYLMDLNYSDETGEVTASVWAVNPEGKLEKRTVILGEYDMMTGSYQVLDGLVASDYVADPTNPNCKEGAGISIYGQTGENNTGMTPEEIAALEASVADSVELGE